MSKHSLTSKPPRGWHYLGDINLEYGGFFYKLTKWGYADIVEITPCSDAGCQTNAWWISQGSRTTETSDETLASALSCIGFEGEVTEEIKVEALMVYGGFERDTSEVVQIGPKDEYGREYVEPTIKLRANADLENFVRKWATWD